ncbi:DUF3726 domain-containing protein [Kiloniella sp. b19]|uniref:DUF3726 domain-containing protein n=1 Tax=Kiloniella sp. GXU_MW_B19 TaxID=3141326 RepID=UPI0031CE75E4
MSYSLNEVEATAKRAARGAGYSWGLSEEAGKATRWLCAHGLDGVGALCVLLEQGLADDLLPNAPQDLSSNRNSQRKICPLLAGAALSDFSAQRELPVSMQKLAVPMLILPFVASVARRLRLCLVVNCGDAVFSTDGVRLRAAGVLPEKAGEVTITAGDITGDETAICTRASPSAESWDLLNSFARRTYAPATEESRLRGAGAGLSDND